MRYRLELKKANALKRMKMAGVGVVAGIVGGAVGLYSLWSDGSEMSIFFGLLCIPLMMANAVLLAVATVDHGDAKEDLLSLREDGRIWYNVSED